MSVEERHAGAGRTEAAARKLGFRLWPLIVLLSLAAVYVGCYLALRRMHIMGLTATGEAIMFRYVGGFQQSYTAEKGVAREWPPRWPVGSIPRGSPSEVPYAQAEIALRKLPAIFLPLQRLEMRWRGYRPASSGGSQDSPSSLPSGRPIGRGGGEHER